MFWSLRAILLSCLVIGMSATACGAPSTDAAKESSKPVVAPLSLAELDTADWLDLSTDALPAPPATPAGVDAAHYREGTEILQRWATAALGDPEQAVQALPENVQAHLVTLANGPAENVSLGTAFDLDFRVLSRWATGAWEVVSLEPLHIEFQSRVLWELARGDDDVRLVGMVRTQAWRFADGEPQLGQSWQEFGADDCALVVDELIRPGGDVENQNNDLADFIEIMNSSRVEPPQFSADEVVDEEFVERCRTGRV